uniref:Venom CRiSP n=1 Tax=Lethocerus distinctifemur TaxID=280095 RepID=A0A2K8JNI2_9HEMI|nr:venom CRiSP [Lethocerus distinctifemur]
MFVPTLGGLLVLSLFTGRSEGQCLEGKLLRSGELNCEEKQAILDKHNTLRRHVAIGNVSNQPSAVNMLQMSWDDELAEEAQDWADRCSFEHTPLEQRKLSRFTYGQNLGMSMNYPVESSLGNAPDFDAAIQDWFNEVYEYGYNGSYNPNSGHYSQVIWADSQFVGCGYVYYYNKPAYSKLYVCNYGPGGNIQGRRAYHQGKPGCTEPDTKPSSEFPGLCQKSNAEEPC